MNDILNSALHLYQQKGLHFTMQDICDDMHVAKKTIYKQYASKEDMLVDLVESAFEEIQACKKEIIESDLSTAEKIRRVVIALPEQYLTLDFRGLEDAKEKYPRLAKCLKHNLTANWDPTIDLLRQGAEEGVIRDINIPVFRMMVTGSIEAFLEEGSAAVTYQQALQDMMDILMEGICKE